VWILIASKKIKDLTLRSFETAIKAL